MKKLLNKIYPLPLWALFINSMIWGLTFLRAINQDQAEGRLIFGSVSVLAFISILYHFYVELHEPIA